jgi:hypothetical protein
MRTLEFLDPKSVEALARARQLYPEAPAHVHEAVANAIRARGDVPLTMHNAIRDGNYEGAIEYAAKIPEQDKDYAVRKFWETEQHDTSWTTDENGQLRFNPPRERAPGDGSDAGQSTERLASARVERLPNRPNGSTASGDPSGGRAFRVDPFDFTGGNTIPVSDGPVSYPGDTYQEPAGTRLDFSGRYERLIPEGRADQDWMFEAMHGPLGSVTLQRHAAVGQFVKDQIENVKSKVATPYTQETPEQVLASIKDPEERARVAAAIEANRAVQNRQANPEQVAAAPAPKQTDGIPGTTTAPQGDMALPNVGDWFDEPQAEPASRFAFTTRDFNDAAIASGQQRADREISGSLQSLISRATAAPAAQNRLQFAAPQAFGVDRTNFAGANDDGTNPRTLKSAFDMPQKNATPDKANATGVWSIINELIGITPADARSKYARQRDKRLKNYAKKNKPFSVEKFQKVLEDMGAKVPKSRRSTRSNSRLRNARRRAACPEQSAAQCAWSER